MINESEIIATKLLRRAAAIGSKFGIPEGGTATMMALITGLYCFYQQRDEIDDDPDLYLHRMLEKLFGPTSHLNENESEELLRKVLDELSQFLGSTERVSLPRNSSVFILELIGAVIVLPSESGSPSSFKLHHIFNQVFRRAVSVAQEREFHNSFRLATFADTLNDSSKPIWEYFMYFGDLCVAQIERGQREAYGSVLPQHELLLKLRLRITGVRLTLLETDQVSEHATLFINHPAYSTTTNEDMEQRALGYTSALSAFAKIWPKFSSRQALVVVPSVDRSAGGARQELREELVSTGALKAIIDVPLQGGKGQRAISASVWVIGRKNPNAQDILCIDASKLPKREFSFDRDSGIAEDMKFIASIINDWLGKKSMQSTILELESNSLAGLFSQYFREGYRDVPGLCRVVHSSEVRQHRYNLNASAYLQITDAPVARSSIDSSAIVSMLDRENPVNVRAYVIGNNGTGKSLLLRELVQVLDQKQIRSVGIAFGATDRFPLHTKTPKGSAFVYRGARTKSNTVNLDAAVASLSKLTKQVHVDQSRLDTFNATMDMLGFDRRHYLVPRHYSSTAVLDDEQLADIIQLTDSALENESMFANLPVRQRQLGLMRREDAGRVVLFDALSSGEQQVLTLAIKLIAEAQPGTVMLVDEPEISMHVAWQRVLPAVLEHISSKLGCSMVIATHSPVLIASATSTSDFRFVARKGALTSLPIQRAQSVDTVLFDDFETYTENNRRVHERCARTVSEVIAHLNSNDNDRMEKVEKARGVLSKMEKIIRDSAHGVTQMQVTADIDLIQKADHAIAEIIRNATEVTAQEEDSE